MAEWPNVHEADLIGKLSILMASTDGPMAFQRPILMACLWMAISYVQVE